MQANADIQLREIIFIFPKVYFLKLDNRTFQNDLEFQSQFCSDSLGIQDTISVEPYCPHTPPTHTVSAYGGRHCVRVPTGKSYKAAAKQAHTMANDPSRKRQKPELDNAHKDAEVVKAAENNPETEAGEQVVPDGTLVVVRTEKDESWHLSDVAMLISFLCKKGHQKLFRVALAKHKVVTFVLEDQTYFNYFKLKQFVPLLRDLITEVFFEFDKEVKVSHMKRAKASGEGQYLP